MIYQIETDDKQQLEIDTNRKTVTYYYKSDKEREQLMQHVEDVIKSKVKPKGVFRILECYYLVQYQVNFKQ